MFELFKSDKKLQEEYDQLHTQRQGLEQHHKLLAKVHNEQKRIHNLHKTDSPWGTALSGAANFMGSQAKSYSRRKRNVFDGW